MNPVLALASALTLAQVVESPAVPVGGGGPPASATPQAPAPAEERFGPGSHMRMLEASAASDVEKGTPTAVVAIGERQQKDPVFRDMKRVLEAELAAKGFNMTPIGGRFLNAVTVSYRLGRDLFGEQPGQGSGNPAVVSYNGPARLPSYRRITVTAYSLADRAHPRLLWRTAVEGEGFSFNRRAVLPPLAKVAARYYGEAVTPLGVADCDNFTPEIGSHLAARPCAPVRAALEQPFIIRQPKVIVETARP